MKGSKMFYVGKFEIIIGYNPIKGIILWAEKSHNRFNFNIGFLLEFFITIMWEEES